MSVPTKQPQFCSLSLSPPKWTAFARSRENAPSIVLESQSNRQILCNQNTPSFLVFFVNEAKEGEEITPVRWASAVLNDGAYSVSFLLSPPSLSFRFRVASPHFRLRSRLLRLSSLRSLRRRLLLNSPLPLLLLPWLPLRPSLEDREDDDCGRGLRRLNDR